MKARIITVTILCGTTACVHGTRPATPPPPVVSSGASATQRPAHRDTAWTDAVRRDTVDVAPAEVKAKAVDVFGDSVADVADTAVSGPRWDIDVRSYETQNRVEHFVAVFTGDARDRFAERIGRGTRYEPMIRAKLKAAGLPEDMTYLALIESGYSPNAYSRAAAVGMWQLMTSTAQGAGLRVDWWVDERRDPVRSTDAAIKFLRYLKDQFGSLYLAAAAYNGGPGRIARGLSRYADDLEGTEGDDVFFALAEKDYLRDETKNYVPQLIAAAIVAKEPTKYGLHIETRPPFEYDSVRVAAATPLVAVAKASGASLAQIAELNPQVLRGMTPPDGPFYARVPVGRAQRFDSAFGLLPASDRVAVTRVVSGNRETLAGVASRRGLSARQLAWYNPRILTVKKTGRLRPGQTILVPTAAVAAAAIDVPDPSIERYGTPKRVKLHVVRRGESLGLIARRYNSSVKTLMRLNGLRKTTVFPGQALVVRGTPRAAGKSSRPRTAQRSHARGRRGE